MTSTRWAAAAVLVSASCAQPAPPAVAVPAPPPCLPTSVASASPSGLPAADAGAGTSPQAFDAAPWIEDLRQLLAEMASHYANIDSAQRDRHMDLPGLAQSTESRLRAAKTQDEARRAFQSFLRAFGDAHLSIDWDVVPDGAPASDAQNASRPLCDRLGYKKPDAVRDVDFTLAPSFQKATDPDTDDVPGGILRLASGARLGIVQIVLFMEQIHPDLCKAAQRDLALADDAACDEACGDRLELAVADRLTAALERRLAQLRASGAVTIVVDITGNGGGTNWVEPAARVVAPVLLQAPHAAVMRHAHAAAQMRDRLKEVEADLPKASGAQKATLVSGQAALRAALVEAETPCDLGAVWIPGAPAPTCSLIARTSLYQTGIVPYAKPGAFAGLASAETLYGPSRYRYDEAANKLPVLVLVDDRTASSAEWFTALLKDNHAATILGQPTAGAGCGFTDGGIKTTLGRSGARVHIPDCVRLRADSTDEVMGITPDVLLPFAGRDSPSQRAVKAVQGLESAWRDRAHR
jgi:hypothetical protein